MTITALKNWLASRERRQPVKLIVLHSTDGASAGSSISWLRQIGLSYHYVIERDGNVTKCVPTTREAFHAGNSWGPLEEIAGTPNTQDRNSNFTARSSVNGYSIGIAFANWESHGEALTGAQIAAARELLLALKAADLRIYWLTTHRAVSPGRKVDPRMLSRVDLVALAKSTGLKVWP